MKFFAHLAAMLLSGSIAFAQTSQTVMIINGKTVSMKEFENAYHKNKSVDGIDRISVGAFADLFVDYRLKVQAALDAHLDTLNSFKQEVERYEGQHDSPKNVSRPHLEDEAKTVFMEKMRNADNIGGVVKTAQILLRLGQRVPYEKQRVVQNRIDSIYTALLRGADFADLARKYSEDSCSAVQGGCLPWLAKGQTVKAFEDVAFSLKKGEVSKPFLSEFGYHIVKLLDRQERCPYDSVKDDIYKFVDAQNLRNNIVKGKVVTEPSALDAVVDNSGQQIEISQDVKEALLVNEICKKEVWAKAVDDERGLAAYYAKNKKKYKGVLALLKKRDGKKKVGLQDVKDLVVADYQDLLEKQWVTELRKKYKVVFFSSVLATMNKN